MNKLSKIGASALAGSLMALSANALEVSISGGASVGIGQSNQTMGTGYWMNDNINFTVSGETDGGLTVTTKLELDGGYAQSASNPYDNTSISIANDMGTLTFAKHGGDSVMSGWDDVVPTAYEEPWALAAHATTASATADSQTTLINGLSGNNLWRYDSPSFNGVSVHASYLQEQQTEVGSSQGSVAAYNDFGIQISPEMIDGLSIGYAMGTVQEAATIENDESTIWVKYVYGPVTLGYQMSEVDGQTTNEDDESTGYGLSYAVSDSLSLSYGVHTLDLGDKNGASTDQESTGFSFSYTMGGATIAGAFNQMDNMHGATNAGADVDSFELGVAFAF